MRYTGGMLTASFDFPALAIVVGGTFLAGFTTGFAGFGTGLVASGLWFHALPAAMVPPLVALASVAAQLVGMMTVREAFNWRRVAPFLLGGVLGVPPGVAALTAVSPVVLKLFVGVFLTAYAMYQLGNRIRWHIGQWGGGIADGIVGLGGGLLGGFAGLSAPLPVMWLQLRGGSRQQQRALYQPFNMVVLALASLGMAVSGQVTADVVWVSVLCLPATLIGAWIGARVYVGVSEQTFQRVVLSLLLLSGLILIAQAFTA